MPALPKAPRKAILDIPVDKILSFWADRGGPEGELTKTKLYEAYFARDDLFDALCAKWGPTIVKLLEYYDLEKLPSIESFFGSEGNDEHYELFPTDIEEVLCHILLLSQFTRKIWRGKDAVKVYEEADPVAHRLALYAADKFLTPAAYADPHWIDAVFLLMPLDHSEHLPSHIRLMQTYLLVLQALFLSVGDGVKDRNELIVAMTVLRPQLDRLEVIGSFGHFPQRNKLLNRACEVQGEADYVARGGTMFEPGDAREATESPVARTRPGSPEI